MNASLAATSMTREWETQTMESPPEQHLKTFQTTGPVPSAEQAKNSLPSYKGPPF